MVFSSILFLVYFLPAFLLLYYLAPSRFKNWVILLGSLVFYAWGAPKFILVILASILLDFMLAQYIHDAKGARKKLLLVVSVSINLGILLYFKYSNFFIENVNAAFAQMGQHSVSWTEVALPIGISFFTFHELSYIIDVYRGVKPPMKKLQNYAVYILMFPQLIAGPIIRFHEIAEQISDRKHAINIDNAFLGFFRFVIGLAKKVLIANVMGEFADRVFDSGVDGLSTQIIWLGALAYTFQIYFDFSGYSDMAIGLARMMGFIFPENFNNPYISQNITEFWQRWHMSLSRWMRDYLYIPLGGNRVSKSRLYFNLCLVFIVSGFWHGAEWTFIVWGAYHGLFLVLDRLFLVRIFAHSGKIFRVAFTFLVVLVGWVIFRAETLEKGMEMIRRMFTITPELFFNPPSFKMLCLLGIAALICFSAIFPRIEKIQVKAYTTPERLFGSAIRAGISSLLFFLGIAELLGSNFNPFIYFRF